jgi:nucleoside-diphosphate-sugar epimerase
MRVFVTGGTGHSGSSIIPELIAAGHEVTGLARSDTPAKAAVTEFIQSIGYSVVDAGPLADSWRRARRCGGPRTGRTRTRRASRSARTPS